MYVFIADIQKYFQYYSLFVIYGVSSSVLQCLLPFLKMNTSNSIRYMIIIFIIIVLCSSENDNDTNKEQLQSKYSVVSTRI